MQDETNPYAAPTTAADVGVATAAENPYPQCPNCGAKNAKKVRYTLWGGAVGPALFKQVKCQSCKTSFNSKTGKPIGTAIAIYLVVSLVLGGLVGLLIAMG